MDQLIREEECLDDLTGQFVIFNKEFQNAVLTSDLLKTIRAVCTNMELNEIMDCKVITACYYKKSDHIESYRDWVSFMETHLNDDDYKYETRIQSIVDRRSRKWTSIKLESLFGRIIDQRQSIKKQIKPAIERGEPSEFVDQLRAKQEVLKLIGNTIYGVISSPYFDIGNTVLSNNITAKARNGIWLASRALNGFQTITDGTQYKPEEVFQFRNWLNFRKPGLETLSDLRKLAKHRSILKGPMMGVDWAEMFLSKNQNHPDLLKADQYAKKHIEDFLAVYGLTLDYEVEHKLEHTSSQMFFAKKAHYILVNYQSGEISYKVRGTSKDENPAFLQIAVSVFEGRQEPEIYQLETKASRISTLHDYKESLKKFSKDPNGTTIILPGYNMEEIKIFRFNSLDLPYTDMNDFQKRHSVKGDVDYAPLLNKMSFHDTFHRRNDDHEKRHIKRK